MTDVAITFGPAAIAGVSIVWAWCLGMIIYACIYGATDNRR